MPTNVNESTSGTTNTNSNDSNSQNRVYRDWMDEGTGTDAEGTEGTTDGTADNVYENDPEKNKKLAEITMAEQLRETYQLTIKIPNILTGLHTNQFFFIELNDQFYEKNYPEIIKAIADKKFAQYSGFEKGRFFIDKVTEKGGMDGWSMELKLNPIPPSLATYSRMQMEATKALIQAINNETDVSYNANVSGQECGEDISTWTSSEWGPSAFEKGASTIIGNSNSNYANDIASMTCEEAIKSINHTYHNHSDNLVCPQELWKTYPNIYANCADFARLVKCICDVKGVKCAIYHGSSHYFNYVYINGNWESVDLCTNQNNNWDGHPRNSAGWQ